jgi:hypothetical protein
MTAAKDFEAAARAQLDRELNLVRAQAEKRKRDRAAPDSLQRRQFAAGAYAPPVAVRQAAAADRVREAIAAAARRALEGPETAYSRDLWDGR